MLFSSTGGAIYGEQDVFPAPETHQTEPLSPYGVAKLASERYLFFYSATYGISYAALRYAQRLRTASEPARRSRGRGDLRGEAAAR